MEWLNEQADGWPGNTMMVLFSDHASPTILSAFTSCCMAVCGYGCHHTVDYIPSLEYTAATYSLLMILSFYTSRVLGLTELKKKHFCTCLIHAHKPERLCAAWDKSYLPLLLEWKLCRCGSTTDNIQYSLCLIPRKSAQETKKSGCKHLSFALCRVHEQTVLHAEHGAIVFFTKLTTKQRLQNRNETLGNRKYVFKC